MNQKPLTTILILEVEGQRWKNVENGHTEYGLENALREIFETQNHRLFRIEDQRVFIIIGDPQCE